MPEAGEVAAPAEDGGRRAKTLLGYRVIAALAVLTAIEYLVAAELTGALVILFATVVAKAWLILKYFMHIDALRSEGNH